MEDQVVKPTFDFTKVSRQWSKAVSATIQKATRAELTLNRPLPQDADNATLLAHYDAQDKALDVIAQISDEQARLVSQVLVDVPREWLIAGSPETIDWSQIESFDYIQEARYGEILAMLINGEARTLAKK